MNASNHFDPAGNAQMVDVSQKSPSVRIAVARGRVTMAKATAEAIRQGQAGKGDVLAVARLAAIQATKLTQQLIPLCHAIPIESVAVEFSPFQPSEDSLEVLECTLTVKTTGKTGVEMEAMTGAAVACLTIYDMVKAIDRALTVGPIVLVEKSGGKSGRFVRG